MKRNKYIFISGFILAVLVMTTYYIVYTRQVKENEIQNGSHIGEFIVSTLSDNGLCGVDEIYLASTSQRIASMYVCEDNLSQLSRHGNWVYGTTSSGRTFRANIYSGEKEIINRNSTRGFGGGISFK